MKSQCWKKRPSKPQIQESIAEFMACIGRGDFEKAFEISPIFDYEAAATIDGKDVQADANDPAEIQLIADALFDTLDAYGYLEDIGDDVATPVKEDVKTWSFHVTAPSFAEFELSMPESDGEIDCPVFIRGDYSDITAIFYLKDAMNGWFLNFKFMKVQ